MQVAETTESEAMDNGGTTIVRSNFDPLDSFRQGSDVVYFCSVFKDYSECCVKMGKNEATTR